MKAVQATTFGDLFQAWPLKPLPEVAFFQEGPGLRKWQWTERGMKVINVTNILGDGTVDVQNTNRFISTEEYETKYRHFAVDAGDTVVASSGNTYGKVGRINKSHLPLMMNTSVVRFHPADPQQLHQDFLFAFLRSDLFKNQMESFVIGSAQPNFGPSHLKRMVIPCPPLTTQRKIASILSAYDDLIENNTRRIAILEEMAQAIYREWYVNFRFLGHENVKLVDSTLGKIPEGWKAGVVNDLLALLSGYACKSETFVGAGEYKVVTIKNVHDGVFDTGTLSLLDVVPDRMPVHCRLQTGDDLMSLTGNIGRTCLVFGENFLLNQRVAKLYPHRKEDCPLVYWMFRSPETRQRLEQIANGVAQQNLSPVQTGKMAVPIPPLELRDNYAEVASAMLDTILNLNRKNATLRTTRDLLLPKLISGQLDVEDLDIDAQKSFNGEPQA